MKRQKKDIHRGQVLKFAVESSRLGKEEIAKIAGYTRSRYYKHITDPELPYHILIAYGKALKYDFTDDLPEMPKYVVEDPADSYGKESNPQELIRQRDYWKDKYLELLEKYNRLIEEKVQRK